MDKAMGTMNSATGTFARQMPNIPAHQDPGPSAGGALMSGLSGAGTVSAIAGTSMGGAALTAMGMSGPVGLGLGAVLGIAGYLLS